MSDAPEPSSESPAPAPTGRRSARGSRSRSKRRWIILIAVVFVVTWCVVAGVQMVQARQHAQKGLDQLESAQHDLGPAQLIRGEGLDRMRAAQDEFDQAASAGDSFFLKPFMVVPVLG